MSGTPDEQIQEMKTLMEKKGSKEVSWEEAREASDRMGQLAELLFDCYVKDEKRKRKLKELPQGFQLDGVGYSCAICGNGTPINGNWYDKYGIKCMICQAAINRKEIPASLAKNREGWYSKYDLESSFNLKGPTLRSWIKKDILKARAVTRDGRIHEQLFLIKDNKETLPPKKLVESRMVRVEENGKEYHSIKPWYMFVNPHEHLKGYKILDHLVFTEEPAKENVNEEKKI